MYIAAVYEDPLAGRMRRFRRQYEHSRIADFFNSRETMFKRNLIGNDLFTSFRIVKGLNSFRIKRRPAFADYDSIAAHTVFEKSGRPFAGKT